MNKKILVVDFLPEQHNAVIKFLNEMNCTILFQDKTNSHLIAEGHDFSAWSLGQYTIIKNPHNDLLPAFFNLITAKKSSSLLAIKSTSLASLMDFYQNLIDTKSYQAWEITLKNTNTPLFYGLFSGKKETLLFPKNIEHKWIKSSTMTYNF